MSNFATYLNISALTKKQHDDSFSLWVIKPFQ